MLKRTIFCVFPPALIIALLSIPAIHGAEAQDPPRPPQPKQTPQQKDSGDKKGARRQGDQTDDPGTPGQDRITIPTDLVRLDATVVDQNNNPVLNLKKEDFSVFEDDPWQRS